MVPKMHILETVCERDIDLLLLEEFHGDPRFALWFCRQVLGQGITDSGFAGAWHSVSDSTGESDLLVIYMQPDGKKLAILIEDKIASPPQPKQAERYRMRGEEGVRQGKWNEFRTCIVAPAKYLNSRESHTGYDACLSYETIAKTIQSLNPDSKRHDFRSMVLTAAIEQQRRGYTPRVHEQVTKFWRDYWEYASREFPELGMKEPNAKPEQSTFIYFAPPQLPKKRYLVHKLTRGCVDLNLATSDPDESEFEASLKYLLADGLSVVKTGKSLSVRARAPSVDHTGDFSSQVLVVREALKAASRFLYVAQALATYSESKRT